jgi:hypothetical protein
MGYVNPNRFSRIMSMPVALAQTELRRGKAIQIMQFNLAAGQMLELRCLNLHLLKILTPGIVPSYATRALGVVSVGLYLGPMLTSGAAIVRGYQIGVSQFNSFQARQLRSPGTYTVVVSNNTSNVDVSVAVTGTLKIYV